MSLSLRRPKENGERAQTLPATYPVGGIYGLDGTTCFHRLNM